MEELSEEQFIESDKSLSDHRKLDTTTNKALSLMQTPNPRFRLTYTRQATIGDMYFKARLAEKGAHTLKI